MQQITSSAWNNGLGAIWIGLTDLYQDGTYMYWSSGKKFDYDFTKTAWGNLLVDGDNGNCAVIFDDGFYDDRDCEEPNYGLCVIEQNIC